MSRWRQLVANTGRSGAVRTVVATVLFTILVVVMAFAERNLVPLLLWTAGLGVPTLARRALVDRVETVSPLVGLAGPAIGVAAIVVGFSRGSLWEEGHPLEAPVLAGTLALLGAYLSAFFWLYSDPEIVRLDDE